MIQLFKGDLRRKFNLSRKKSSESFTEGHVILYVGIIQVVMKVVSGPLEEFCRCSIIQSKRQGVILFVLITIRKTVTY